MDFEAPAPALERPTEVRPRLFLGGIMSFPYLRELGITHILSILNMCVADLIQQHGTFTKLDVWLPDTPSADILQHLPAAVAFVRGALHGGGRVLVVTAYLMKSEGLSARAAAEALVRVHPRAWPNEGFRRALDMWGEAGCPEDANTLALRRQRMEALGRQWADAGAVAPALLPSPDEAPAVDAVLYRCRRCRRIVASSANAIPVEKGDGAFRGKRRDRQGRGAAAEGSAETSLFVEPLRWMSDALQVGEDRLVSGKLSCPGCGARLGAFNWAGAQSCSGAWVTPAFQLHRARLDAAAPAPAPGRPAAAVPALLASRLVLGPARPAGPSAAPPDPASAAPGPAAAAALAGGAGPTGVDRADGHVNGTCVPGALEGQAGRAQVGALAAPQALQAATCDAPAGQQGT